MRVSVAIFVYAHEKNVVFLVRILQKSYTLFFELNFI
jgi:hypothetical protein